MPDSWDNRTSIFSRWARLITERREVPSSKAGVVRTDERIVSAKNFVPPRVQKIRGIDGFLARV